MNAPTLLIGLGGVGSKIVERVSGLITPEQRESIAVVVLDTDINDLRAIRERNPFIRTIKKYICEGYMVPRQQNVEQKAFDRRSGTGQIDFAPGF